MLHTTMFLATEGITRLEREFIRWLAIAGGFLVGLLLTHLVLILISRFLLRRELPGGLQQFLRVGGGVAAAILVFFLLAGSGGSGWGGAGGSQMSSDGAKEENKKQPEVPESKKEESKEKVLNTPTPPTTPEERLVILILRPVETKKFFRTIDDPKPLTLEEVMSIVREREKKTEKPLKVVQINLYLDSSYTAGTALQAKVQELGLIADVRKMGIALPER